MDVIRDSNLCVLYSKDGMRSTAGVMNVCSGSDAVSDALLKQIHCLFVVGDYMLRKTYNKTHDNIIILSTI